MSKAQMRAFDQLSPRLREALANACVRYEPRNILDYVKQGVPENQILQSIEIDQQELRALAAAEKAVRNGL